MAEHYAAQRYQGVLINPSFKEVRMAPALRSCGAGRGIYPGRRELAALICGTN